MKKWLSAILCIVTVLMCVLVFASCAAKPELDLETAAENLEDEDYNVQYSDDEDELDVNVAERLTASKSNGDDYDDYEYIQITVYKDVKSAKAMYEMLKLQQEVSKKSMKNEIEQLKNKLATYEDDLENEDIDDIEDEIEELEESLERLEEIVYGRSGKTVWYGTKDAIDATKG